MVPGISYRAMNICDEWNYKNCGAIFCNGYNNYVHNKDTYGIYRRIFDKAYGHIGGMSLKNSLLISSSKDFDYVVTEYAIPQAGKFNKDLHRKPVAIIEIGKMYDDKDCNTIKNLREQRVNGTFSIDVSNGNLLKFFDSDAIIPEKGKTPKLEKIGNENICYYSEPTETSNYATSASEIVTLLKIDSIKFLIYPIMQDILYGLKVLTDEDKNEWTSLIDENKYIDFIQDIEKHVKYYLNNYPSFLNSLYYFDDKGNITKGANLTDILFNNYNKLPGETIEDKYSFLKEEKQACLNNLLTYIKQNVPLSKYITNNYNLNDLTINRVVDDKIYVSNFNNINKNNFSKTGLHDILLIKHYFDVYKYNPKTNRYESSNNKIIPYDYMKKYWSSTPKPIKPVQKKKCIRY